MTREVIGNFILSCECKNGKKVHKFFFVGIPNGGQDFAQPQVYARCKA